MVHRRKQKRSGGDVMCGHNASDYRFDLLQTVLPSGNVVLVWDFWGDYQCCISGRNLVFILHCGKKTCALWENIYIRQFRSILRNRPFYSVWYTGGNSRGAEVTSSVDTMKRTLLESKQRAKKQTSEAALFRCDFYCDFMLKDVLLFSLVLWEIN